MSGVRQQGYEPTTSISRPTSALGSHHPQRGPVTEMTPRLSLIGGTGTWHASHHRLAALASLGDALVRGCPALGEVAWWDWGTLLDHFNHQDVQSMRAERLNHS